MSASANGEGSSRRNRTESTLSDVLREPSRVPDVVVLTSLPETSETKEALDPEEVLDPEEDLWLATNDGRYSSPIIPIRVGIAPYHETFQVHRGILLKSEWFRTALCGGFKEAVAQSLDLPDEDPAIIHFLIAYLYEDRYVPTTPLATVLVPDEEKGKGRENENDSPDSDSDSNSDTSGSGSLPSRSTWSSRRCRQHEQRKHPGRHHYNCLCLQCHRGPSWPSPAPRVPPQAAAPLPPGAIFHQARGASRHGPGPGRGGPVPAGEIPQSTQASPDPPRIEGEDLRTWLIAYELNIDAYICANKFLLDGFKDKVARVTIDMLETAGADAAQIEVLHLCRKLYEGVSDHDRLLKMVFARVGFLQSALWQRAPVETQRFLVEHPEVGALILKETAIRGEEEFRIVRNVRSALPSMERGLLPSPAPAPAPPHPHPHPPHPMQRVYQIPHPNIGARHM